MLVSQPSINSVEVWLLELFLFDRKTESPQPMLLIVKVAQFDLNRVPPSRRFTGKLAISKPRLCRWIAIYSPLTQSVSQSSKAMRRLTLPFFFESIVVRAYAETATGLSLKSVSVPSASDSALA